MLFTPEGLNNVGGPIAMFQMSSLAMSLGISSFFFLWGVISINLAVMNFLPIPGLDGWHFLVLIVEAITRKENMIYPRKLTTQDLSKNDERLIAVTRAIAGAIKEIINTPILSTNGNITMESQEISEKITLNLPGLRKKVNEVRMYRV